MQRLQLLIESMAVKYLIGSSLSRLARLAGKPGLNFSSKEYHVEQSEKSDYVLALILQIIFMLCRFLEKNEIRMINEECQQLSIHFFYSKFLIIDSQISIIN